MSIAAKSEGVIEVGANVAEAVPSADDVARLKRMLVGRVAEECARRGWKRIALYGAGRHTRMYIRQPWGWHGVRVVAVVDDNPGTDRIGGIEVVRPTNLCGRIDAVVVSSDRYEDMIAERAAAVFGARGIPVVRIYGDEPAWEADALAEQRLIDKCGVPGADARWLVANRLERHDATLPILPPARTELHLRRYELAAAFVQGKRVLDAACGTGYGAAVLMEQGRAAGVIGVDIDEEATAYARRRFGREGVEFRVCSAAQTALPNGSVDVVTSFETIEHMHEPGQLLEEFARVLRPGGTLVLSTPNDWGVKHFHEHSFTRESLRDIVEERFRVVQWIGQRAGDAPALDGLPAGMFPLGEGTWAAETLMVVAEKR
jgi:ubiquinone/menaquinone biosynthesis C-methylase UbiE